MMPDIKNNLTIPNHVTQKQQDTDFILGDWSEILQVKCKSNSYDNKNMATTTWVNKGNQFNGDWQPATGRSSRSQPGLKVIYDAVVFCSVNVSVDEGDRIYRTNGTFENVTFVAKHEDHFEIFLNKTEGEI